VREPPLSGKSDPDQEAFRDPSLTAKPTAAFDAKWGQFVITPAFFTRLVYQDA
jgi:hypothetical protein